ncbi:hypothetical protein [Companilactobacillus sp. HBUAS56257]|uniref:hypothetical protein n=1 Tax=Companilactobacillus sp. HBUAS56257 TaxID=3109360 RepID=UPI002FEF3CD4
MKFNSAPKIILSWDLLMSIREITINEERPDIFDFLKKLRAEGQIFFSFEVLSYFKQFLLANDGSEFVSCLLSDAENAELAEFEDLEGFNFSESFSGADGLAMSRFAAFQTLKDLEMDLENGLVFANAELIFVDFAGDDSKMMKIQNDFCLGYENFVRHAGFTNRLNVIEVNEFWDFLMNRIADTN